MADNSNAAAPTSGQEPTAAARPQQGTGYSVQAADAGAAERPGADGGRGRSPSHASDPNAPTNEAHASLGSDDDSSTDVEALRAQVKALRAEAAAGRKAKQELDQRKQEEELAKLSEEERNQKLIADLTRERDLAILERQEALVRVKAEVAAEKLGLAKPEKALQLIDQSAIEYDERGVPTNIAELLTQALEDLGLTPPAKQSDANSPAAATTQNGRTAPQTGATNPPRSGITVAANGVFGATEIPRLTDPRLWKR